MEKLPKVLLMGIPECGIQILNEIVQKMPNLRSGLWLNQWEGDIFTSLESLNQGEVWTGYVNYSGDLKQFLDDNEIRRFFIYRDPRDMILSYLFYILGDENNHIHHKYFTEHLESMDERIMKLIEGFNETKEIAKQYGLEAIGYGSIKHHFLPYLRWLHDPNTCVIRYEDLMNKETRLQEMTRMVNYLWDDIKHSEMDKTDYLQRFLEMKFSQALTQTSSSEWKQYFTEEIESKFMEEAGELLTYLGYENDEFESENSESS